MSYKVTNLTDKTLYAGEHVFIPHDFNQVSSLNPEIINFADQGLFLIGPWEVDSKISKEDLAQKLDFKKGAALAQFPSFDVGTVIKSKSNPGPGWLECDGAPYTRADYPELAALRPHAAFVAEVLTRPTPFSAMIHISGNTFLAIPSNASGFRSLYKSIDNGTTWTLLTDVFPILLSRWSNMSRHRLTGVLMLSDWSTGNMYKSVNDGETWTQVTTPTGVAVNGNIHLLGDPLVAGKWVVWRSSTQTKMNISADDGATWTEYTLPMDRYCAGIYSSGYASDYFLFGEAEPYMLEHWGTGNYKYSAPATYSTNVDPFNLDIYSIDEFSQTLAVFTQGTWTWDRNPPTQGHIFYGSARYNKKTIAVSKPKDTHYSATFNATAALFSYDGMVYESGLNVFPNLTNIVMGWLRLSASNESIMLLAPKDSSSLSMLRITQDPTKFNNFGISPEGSIKAYVYTGKTN